MSVQFPPLLEQERVAPVTEPTVVIEPTRGWTSLQLRELWRYRELLFFFVWRDVKVRYKQSILGILWVVVQPVVTMIVFTILFNRILGVGSDSEIPYPIFAYTALLPWTYFASTLSRGSTGLVVNRNLISKIYFPRLAVPIADTLSGLVDFGVAFATLLVLMFYFKIALTAQILLVPLALLLAMTTVLGVVLWLSALNVQYRDIQHIAPFLIQIWMYATPIIYPLSRIPEKWQWFYGLNPMVGVVQTFRWALLGERLTGFNWLSVALALLLLLSGVIYFRQTERIFADVV